MGWIVEVTRANGKVEAFKVADEESADAKAEEFAEYDRKTGAKQNEAGIHGIIKRPA